MQGLAGLVRRRELRAVGNLSSREYRIENQGARRGNIRDSGGGGGAAGRREIILIPPLRLYLTVKKIG